MFIHHKRNFFIGIFILLLVLSGLPLFWKYFLIILSAIALAVFSLKFEMSHFFKKNNTDIPLPTPSTSPISTPPAISTEVLKVKRVRRKPSVKKSALSVEKENPVIDQK